MCIDTERVDGILYGTETLEQNNVPSSSRTESYSGLSFTCWRRKKIKSVI